MGRARARKAARKHKKYPIRQHPGGLVYITNPEEIEAMKKLVKEMRKFFDEILGRE